MRDVLWHSRDLRKGVTVAEAGRATRGVVIVVCVQNTLLARRAHVLLEQQS